MQNNCKYAIGLMSGTSLDGVDLVYVQFTNKNSYKIIYGQTVLYSEKWKKKLQNAFTFSEEALQKLDSVYGEFLGKELVNFITVNSITEIDFIASHGHTIFHQPEKGVTLQIGSGRKIAQVTQQTVVCDFRTQDVQFGGQGAPLVPIGDQLLFANYAFCLNLGGFANISFAEKNTRIAFDICPVNIVLNYYCNKLGLIYDDGGKIAAKGKINTSLLNKLNNLDFYTKKPPKSLGLEWVNACVFPLIDSLENHIPTILRTVTEHIAMQIGKIIQHSNSILVTGGGAFNTFLINRIEYYSKTPIQLPSNNLIHYKEALVFAFLGLLRIDNQVNCLKSVTGASKNHSSGKIFYPE